MGRLTTQKRKRAIDWSDVRRRLAVAAARSADRLDATAERAILDERARKLARPLEQLESEQRLELVTFELTGERYAIESSCVIQVVKLQDLVRLPGAPEHLLGLTNLRGDILPVFDLRALLEVSRAQLNDLSRLLVMGTREPEFGILADAVLEIERRRPSELLPSAQGLGRENLPYLRGVTADALIVLDGQALLHDPRLFLNVAEPAAENQEP